MVLRRYFVGRASPKLCRMRTSNKNTTDGGRKLCINTPWHMVLMLFIALRSVPAKVATLAGADHFAMSLWGVHSMQKACPMLSVLQLLQCVCDGVWSSILILPTYIYVQKCMVFGLQFVLLAVMPFQYFAIELYTHTHDREMESEREKWCTWRDHKSNTPRVCGGVGCIKEFHKKTACAILFMSSVCNPTANMLPVYCDYITKAPRPTHLRQLWHTFQTNESHIV